MRFPQLSKQAREFTPYRCSICCKILKELHKGFRKELNYKQIARASPRKNGESLWMGGGVPVAGMEPSGKSAGLSVEDLGRACPTSKPPRIPAQYVALGTFVTGPSC